MSEQQVKGIALPTKKRPATLHSPKRMVLFSKPKVGKTSVVAQLPGCLILDFEQGTEAIDALAVKIEKIDDVYQIIHQLKTEPHEYQYICLDTASAIEEMALPLAEIRYSQSPEGSNWFLKDKTTGKLHKSALKRKYRNILNLPFGKGYALVADIFNEILTELEKVVPKVIILAHSTYSTINKDGVDFTGIDIQLSKKSRFMATYKADAIGYMYRDGSKNFINFTASDDIVAGGRHRYLEKEHILISEFIGDDQGNEELVTYWDKVFIKQK
jgi:hypothetical protein